MEIIDLGWPWRSSTTYRQQLTAILATAELFVRMGQQQKIGCKNEHKYTPKTIDLLLWLDLIWIPFAQKLLYWVAAADAKRVVP